MWIYIARRLLALIPLFLLVSMLIFLLTFLVPGDPAVTIAGEFATDEQIQRIRRVIGLDKPIVEQYLSWIGGVVQGDFGTSIYRDESVSDAIGQRIWPTMTLTAGSLLFATLIGVPAAAFAAVREGKVVDRFIVMMSTLGVGIPTFWLGFMLVLAFSVKIPWFPSVGYVPLSENLGEGLRHLVLPCITLGATAAAHIALQLRSSLRTVLHQDYIRTAYAAGLSKRTIIGWYALKNASIPVVTVIGFQATHLLAGSIIVEQVFGIPGIGQLAINAVVGRDVPMVLGIVAVSTTVVVLVNTLVDISYGFFNPKVRHGH